MLISSQELHDNVFVMKNRAVSVAIYCHENVLYWTHITLKMEAIYSQKLPFLLDPHSAIFQKTFIIVTAVRTSQKTLFFGPTNYFTCQEWCLLGCYAEWLL
jgi:hypothetical protein